MRTSIAAAADHHSVQSGQLGSMNPLWTLLNPHRADFEHVSMRNHCVIVLNYFTRDQGLPTAFRSSSASP